MIKRSHTRTQTAVTTRRLYQRLAQSTTKRLILVVSMLGVGALPCPDCGTPMIFHIWPIAGLILAVRAIKKRYREEEQFIDHQPRR